MFTNRPRARTLRRTTSNRRRNRTVMVGTGTITDSPNHGNRRNRRAPPMEVTNNKEVDSSLTRDITALVTEAQDNIVHLATVDTETLATAEGAIATLAMAALASRRSATASPTTKNRLLSSPPRGSPICASSNKSLTNTRELVWLELGSSKISWKSAINICL